MKGGFWPDKSASELPVISRREGSFTHVQNDDPIAWLGVHGEPIKTTGGK